eukprot:TRINITY_DN3171_c0_g2_i1.p1 TRINITY_DN3171_c0_g2~~TRINITY_DN3171_c0_g2_i1.p1  ORF type:complete len:414 (+),score=100.65 TRINITY_DN3171_c0_g2_i1:326-1567(+)
MTSATAGDVFASDGHAEVASVMDTDTVAHLLSVLSRHNVSSVPVMSLRAAEEQVEDDDDNGVGYANRAGGAREPSVAGAVDVLDIVGALLAEDVQRGQSCGEDPGGEPGGAAAPGGGPAHHAVGDGSLAPDKLPSWAARAPHYFGQPVSAIMGLSPTNPLVVVHRDATLDELLSRFSLEARRVMDIDAAGRVRSVLSAWGVVRFLVQHQDAAELRGCGDRALRTLDAGRTGVDIVGCAETDTALGALEVLFGSVVPIYGAPILDSSGAVVDVISASDAKRLTPDTFPDLELPVREFLARGSPRRGPPVTCTSASTLLDVARLMIDRRVHRVFIVQKNEGEGGDENDDNAGADGKSSNPPFRPVGVVSCVDIIDEVRRWRASAESMQSAVRKINTISRVARTLRSVLGGGGLKN